jgi:hypothetical protein
LIGTHLVRVPVHRVAVVGLVLEKMGLAVLQPVVHVPPPPPVVAQEMTVGQLMGPVMVDVMVTWPSVDKVGVVRVGAVHIISNYAVMYSIV